MKTMFTLTEMAAELERQNATKVDYLADPRTITFETGETGSELDLLGSVSGLKVNDLAHQQIGGYLDIPRKFYDRLRASHHGLLDENVNTLLAAQTGKKRMVRTLDGNARAFLSDVYRRVDNYDIAQSVLPILGKIPDVQIRSCGLTESRMYIKAVTPRITGEIKVGDQVCAGVYIGNSEVGRGSLEVYPFVERLICTNGMVVAKAGEGMMRKVHLGARVSADNAGRVFRAATLAADDKALLMAIEDVVSAAVDEVNFRDLLAEMARAASDTPVDDPIAAVQVLAKAENLTEDESRDVLKHLATGGDLSRWGVLNAVTRTAEDAESYDRAHELEALGGKILTYVPAEWTALATA